MLFLGVIWPTMLGLHGVFLGMEAMLWPERRELSGTYDLAAFCRGRACVFQLKYNCSLLLELETGRRL